MTKQSRTYTNELKARVNLEELSPEKILKEMAAEEKKKSAKKEISQRILCIYAEKICLGSHDF